MPAKAEEAMILAHAWKPGMTEAEKSARRDWKIRQLKAMKERQLTCKADCALCSTTGFSEYCGAYWMSGGPPMVERDGGLKIDVDPAKCIYLLPRALGWH